MDTRSREKDVEIDGVKYRVDKFSVKIALYISEQIFTKIIPLGIEGKLNIGNLSEDRPIMTEQELSDLIDYCMCACKRYDKVGDSGVDVAVPVMVKKGTWAIPELEYDLATVVALCVHSLTFNLVSFFKGGALKKIAESLTDLKDLPLFNIKP